MIEQILSYDILGLINIQTYLIIALIYLVPCAAFDKKNKSEIKLICQALIWPWNVIVLCIGAITLVAVFLLAFIEKMCK